MARNLKLGLICILYGGDESWEAFHVLLWQLNKGKVYLSLTMKSFEGVFVKALAYHPALIDEPVAVDIIVVAGLTAPSDDEVERCPPFGG